MTRYAVLRRSQGFRRFWTAATLSMAGGELSLLAFPLLVLALHEGAAQAGAIMTCALLTGLALRLPAGAVVDRFDLRRILIGTDLVRFVALASIPLARALGGLSYPQLLGVAVIEGAAGALFGPASNIAVRDTVHEDDLERALSCLQLSSTLMGLVGPLLGGWLFTVDPMLPFAGDAASYLGSALLLAGMRLPGRDASSRPAGAGREQSSVRWLLRQRALLRVVLFAGVLNLIGTAVGMTVVIALREQGQSGTAIGVVTAGAGVGAVLGAMCAPRLTRLLGDGWLFVAIGTLWALDFVVLATTPPPWLTGVMLACVTFLSPSSSIVVQRALMVMAPREMLGRVLAAAGLLLTGVASLGPLAVGATLQGLGPSRAWLVLALCCGLATLVSAVPLVRDGRLLATQPSTPDPAAAGVSH